MYGYMTSTNQPKQIRTFSASFNQTFASFAICKNWTTKDVWGAPDLVVEILSPGNSAKEMKTKKLLYEENEIREYWILTEHETAFQFHLTEVGVYSPATIYVNEDILICVIFPDLKINMKQIFRFDEND